MAGLGLAPVWAEHLAAAVFAQGGIALAVLDTDLRIIATNATPEAFPRTPLRVGDLADTAFPALGLDGLPGLLRRVLDAGGPAVREQPVAARAPDGGPLRLRIAVFRVPAGTAAPIGVLVTFNDVTDQARAASRAALAREAAAAIGTSLDVTENAQRLADLLVPAWADLVAVDLAEAGRPCLRGDRVRGCPLCRACRTFGGCRRSCGVRPQPVVEARGTTSACSPVHVRSMGRPSASCRAIWARNRPAARTSIRMLDNGG